MFKTLAEVVKGTKVVEVVGGPGMGKSIMLALVVRASGARDVLFTGTATYPLRRAHDTGLKVGLHEGRSPERADARFDAVVWDTNDPPESTHERASARIGALVDEAYTAGRLLAVSNLARTQMDNRTARMPPELRKMADVTIHVLGVEASKSEGGTLAGKVNFSVVKHRTEVARFPITGFAVDIQTLDLTGGVERAEDPE